MLEPSEREWINRLVMKVERLERQVEFLTKHLGVAYKDAGPALDEVGLLLKAGDKMGAIRAYQARTNAGLAEAKKAVEELASKLGF